MGLAADILQKVDSVTLSYTAQSYQAIVARHSTELHLLLVVYIGLYGIAVLQGILPGTVQQMSRHILKAFIAFELATNWGTFTIFFYNVFTSGPDKLTGALTGGINPSQQLGALFDVGMDCAARIFQKAGILSPSIMVTGVLVVVGTILLTGYALFLLVLSKLGLAILLSLAPLFITFALWRSTQGLFQGWINYLVNFALIPVLTYALLALVLAIMQGAALKIEQAGESVGMYDVLPYLLIGCISTLLFAQVNRIASALGGGIALTTLGSFSRYVNQPINKAAKWTGTKIAKGGAAATRWGGGKVYQGAQRIYGRIRGNPNQTSSQDSTSFSSASVSSANSSSKSWTSSPPGRSSSLPSQGIQQEGKKSASELAKSYNKRSTFGPHPKPKGIVDKK